MIKMDIQKQRKQLGRVKKGNARKMWDNHNNRASV